MFDSPPVFAWVLPVIVRLQPGKEETFSPCHGHVFFVFPTWSTFEASSNDEGTWWEGPGQAGQGQGQGQEQDKGKGKGSGAGVGRTYANPGRPKSFQPTQQDRQQTGDIAEYFRRTQNTPRPEARVFAGAQMRGGLEASRPRASPATDAAPNASRPLASPATDAAPNSEILADFLAEYGSGSEDADPSHPDEGLDVIDVDQEASQAADSRMKELRKKWTAHVKKTQQGKDREEVQLPDPLIEKLETMIKNKSKRAKNVRISWSLEDKRTVLAVFKVLNRK
jgi:hypothetical protein